MDIRWRCNQCHRQSKRSEGPIKLAKFFHIKTDLVQLEIMLNFKNSALCLKNDILRPAAFLSSFRIRLKNLSAAVTAT